MASSNQGNHEASVSAAMAHTAELRAQRRADLERIANGDPEALDENYGFNNDELLRLGIGYGIPGPLSDEQVQREAAEILAELVE